MPAVSTPGSKRKQPHQPPPTCSLRPDPTPEPPSCALKGGSLIRRTMMTRKTGKSYERQVTRYLLQQRQRVAFELDVKIRGGSGLSRQIDV